MSLPNATRHYINGAWSAPQTDNLVDLINPATESPIGKVAMGGGAEVNAAVAAAKEAFPAFSQTTRAERLDWLNAIKGQLIARNEEIATAISQEMGAPMGLAKAAQAPSGIQHFAQITQVLEDFQFEEDIGSTRLRREPVGVVAMITPWNWPLNQVAAKVAPAIAAGCTMVLKPSELAPLSAVIMAEIIDEVGLPAGAFNLVQGDGLGVGAPLAAHADIDMVSFTGSTRAGVAISEGAAPTIKRVSLELGGKSANIILDDADFAKAIPAGVQAVMMNTGQSCNAPTRMLVPEARYEEAAALAKAAAEATVVGDPNGAVMMGPIANKAQFERVNARIREGVAAGADLVAGGEGAPQEGGYFVQPTVFGRVTREMSIAREEIFGPVLSIMTYKDEDEAIEIANDTQYGLSGAVWGGDKNRAVSVASQLRTGMVHVNGAGLDSAAPFGGYKMSGNGREWGVYGLEEYLEVKSVYGANT